MHLNTDSFEKLFMSKDDLEFVFMAWKQFHLKPVERVPDDVLERMKKIFDGSNIQNWVPEGKLSSCGCLE